jgi:hypothetical protein
VNGLAVLVVEDFVLGIRKLQAARAAHLHGAKQHDVLPGREHIAKKCLVQPRDPDRRRPVVHDGVEDLEPRPPRRPQAAAQKPARHGGDLARLE